jgi:hypothetical protein
VEGIGTYLLDLGDSIMILKGILYAPSIKENLIFISTLMKKGLEVRFYNNRVSLGKDKKVFAMRNYVLGHDLFKLAISDDEINEMDVISSYTLCYLSKCELWHLRLVHVNKSKIIQMMKMNILLQISNMELDKCQHCLVKKMTKKPFGLKHKLDELLGLIHLDVCGPLSV